jgi:hypothetical protein
MTKMEMAKNRSSTQLASNGAIKNAQGQIIERHLHFVWKAEYIM